MDQQKKRKRLIMEDKLSIQRIQEISPELREELTKIYNECCLVLSGKAILRFAYVFRSFAEQSIIYEQGRTRPGKIVTNAKPGQSIHNYRYAVDIVLLKDTDGNGTFETASWETNVDFDGDGIADWMEVVAIFKKYGWTWGGDWDGDGKTKAQGDKDENFVDFPHFQKIPKGETLKSLQLKYPKGR